MVPLDPHFSFEDFHVLVKTLNKGYFFISLFIHINRIVLRFRNRTQEQGGKPSNADGLIDFQRSSEYKPHQDYSFCHKVLVSHLNKFCFSKA